MTIKLRQGGLYKCLDGSVMQCQEMDYDGLGYGRILSANQSGYGGIWGYREDGLVSGFGPDFRLTAIKEIEP